MSVNEKMTAIADNIRDKTGGIQALSLDDMASSINEVYEAGKKSEYDDFWDNANLDKVSQCSFSGPCWNDNNFKPPRDIVWGKESAQWSFARNNITNLKACLERQNVKLDLSKAVSFSYIFNGSPTTQLPELNFTGASALTNIGGSMNKLVSVDKIILPDEYAPNSTGAIQMFPHSSKLQHLTIEGPILYSWALSVSPLSVESLKSIITHLKDYSEDSEKHYEYTVTFLAATFETLETEGGTSPNGNTWSEYIDDLKWNLVKA